MSKKSPQSLEMSESKVPQAKTSPPERKNTESVLHLKDIRNVNNLSVASIDGYILSKYPNCLPYIGIIFALVHVGFYCGIASFVKLITYDHPDIESNHILIFRGFFQLFILYPIAKYYHSPMFYSDDHMGLLLLRSLFGWANAFFIYKAYQTIELGTAASLQSSSPVIVFLLSYCLLNESMDYIKWLAPLMTIAGTFFIARPSFLFPVEERKPKEESTYFWGVVYSLISAFSVAGAIVFLRKLKECSTILVLVWYSIACIIMSTIVLTYNRTWMIKADFTLLGYLVLVSLFGLSSQTFMTLSLKYTKASMVSIVRSTTIIVNFIIDYVAFDHQLKLLPIIGSGFIIAAVLLLAIHDHYVQDTDDEDKQSDIKKYKSNEKHHARSVKSTKTIKFDESGISMEKKSLKNLPKDTKTYVSKI